MFSTEKATPHPVIVAPVHHVTEAGTKKGFRPAPGFATLIPGPGGTFFPAPLDFPPPMP